MENEMTKPVCAIVGIGPGNGAALARRFDEAGHAIALLSRSTGYSDELAVELADAQSFSCDASDPDSIAAAFKGVSNDMGKVDTLIWNAGGGTWKSVEDITLAEFELGWRINTLGALAASQQVIPAMKAKRAGNIIFIGATASLRGGPMTAGFASAKAAQRSLAQSMAKHLGPQGIHVSLIIIDGQIRSERNPGTVGTGDRLEPADIARLAHYLATQPGSCWTFEADARPHAEKW
jgi:NAD(P)-dependent dehydrogenase (short-subunit alcohol dehydrogenase family)